jgi:nitroreductase
LISTIKQFVRGVARHRWQDLNRASTWLSETLQNLAGPRFGGLYYGLVSPRFRREQRAFLEGKNRYEREQRSDQSSRALLRRNVHRLEKGLSMRPRRPVFAIEYIGETVEAFEKRLRFASEAPEEIAWARAVLDEYFSGAGSDPRIARWSERYRACAEAEVGPSKPGRLAPYQRDLSRPPAVAYEQLLELAVRRRSVRWFLPEPVPRELLEKAMKVALLSPSACNRQPFVFRCFDSAEWRGRVAQVPMGTSGYAHNIPAVIVVVGQMRNFFDERDRHLIYIDSALAAMSFAFAAETLGLSTCLINWPDLESKEHEMAGLIGLEADERPIMLIAVGYPDPEASVPASVKRTPSELLRYNFE